MPNVQSAAAETPAAEHYRAVIDPVVHKEEPYPSYNSIDPMVVFPEDVDYSGGPVPNESEIVYCFNISKPFPTNDAAVRFERNAGEPLKNYADNPREDAEQGVLNALKNGYPVNKAGLQEKLGLTDAEFRAATQLAVWFYTDSRATFNSKVPSNVKEATEILTGRKDAPVTLVQADPEKETLAIFTQVEGTGAAKYQHLLTAKFVNPDTGEEIEEPKLSTSATDQADSDKNIAAEGGTVVDKVTFEGLTPGEDYTVTGELMEKTDDGPVATGITAKASFVPKASQGTVNVTFDVPEGYAGKQLVVFEKLLNANGDVVATHENIDDEAQTVYVEEPTPTETPEPSGTPEPTPTETPVPSGTPEPTPTETPEPSGTPEPTPTETPEPSVTPEPTPTETPEPTGTPEPTPTESTPAETKPSESTPSESAPATKPADDGGKGNGLAETGAENVAGLLVIGAGALIVGGLLVTRRRQDA
nr:VaFE repeat-containing surface-anchored protein [Pseudoclavibacter sp. Marseille-Q3772]